MSASDAGGVGERNAESSDVDRADEFDQRRARVLIEQAAALRLPMAFLVFAVAVIVWSSAPTPLVLAWSVGTIAAREARLASLRWIATRSGWEIDRQLRVMATTGVINGLANGLAALFMHWTDPVIDAILTMILVSLGAGAVASSSVIMPAFHLYVAPLFVLTGLMWLRESDWEGVMVAILLGLFYTVHARTARNTFETFAASYRIRSENAALARRLHDEQGRLGAARDEAVRANLEKSRFLAAASHDLRQPMQSLLLNSGEMLRLPLSDEARLVGRDIASGVRELHGMLDALLDVSKLDAGAVIAVRRVVAIDRLVTRVAAGFRASAQAKQLGWTVTADERCSAYTDPDLLRRVLANLIDNAIKFTAGGRVDVEVRRRGPLIVVSVRDTGLGIAPEYHRQIFDDLVQLQNPERDRSKGHGLGLGIVRRLVDLLGLRLTVDSTPGAGSRFELTFDAIDEASMTQGASSSAGGVERPPGGRGRLEGLRLLVVDDDSMVRGALFHALTAIGCVVQTAASGADALRCLAEARPDAALVDWRLADGESGLDVVAWLRERSPGLPCLIVSADADDALRHRAGEAVIDVLRKPVDIDVLQDTLSRVHRAGADAMVPPATTPPATAH